MNIKKSGPEPELRKKRKDSKKQDRKCRKPNMWTNSLEIAKRNNDKDEEAITINSIKISALILGIPSLLLGLAMFALFIANLKYLMDFVDKVQSWISFLIYEVGVVFFLYHTIVVKNNINAFKKTSNHLLAIYLAMGAIIIACFFSFASIIDAPRQAALNQQFIAETIKQISYGFSGS